ncbi:hypothetical protein CFP66_19480, partial [Pseudonocardia sp. MH-G8]
MMSSTAVSWSASSPMTSAAASSTRAPRRQATHSRLGSEGRFVVGWVRARFLPWRWWRWWRWWVGGRSVQDAGVVAAQPLIGVDVGVGIGPAVGVP